ncbi:MAG: hypothetical protein RLZZ591_1408 [Pseudomonadota bacterium]
MLNPSIKSERPNVLIMLDNTANWNQAFDNEKSSLVSIINSLTEQFNVGLGMYVETGGGNDNADGAYIRFGVRQMKNSDASPTNSGTALAPNNRYALSNLINGLDKLGDKGNNNTISLAMSEVYRYFKGDTSYSSYGKIKTDYNGNISDNPLSAGIGNNAFTSTSPTSTSLFNSPVIDGCQFNFVIYIANGKFNENESASKTSLARLTSAKGATPSTIAISPSGQQDNWADEWAKYLANTGFTKSVGGTDKTVFVKFYTVAVDPTSNDWDSDSLALMKSIANNGDGKYFTTTSGDGGASISDALNQIFTEIQAVNTVFASTTLPVSVNVRGTNINQVYIGMFRPDGDKAPRWYGNLKQYKLALDSLGTLFLTDALGAKAEDVNTGFISNTSSSFWTTTSSFWDWRGADENGPGGGSDKPDGNLVEKGAVAQKLRETYASSQTSRNLYTCTSGCNACVSDGSGSSQVCTGGSALSATPFANSNTSITAAALNLGTKTVSPLSGKRSISLSALTDRRSVNLNNTGSGNTYTLTSLNNGASTKAISSISTGVTTAISALTAANTSTQSLGISGTSSAATGVNNQYRITVTTASAHNYSVGTSVTISGNLVSAGQSNTTKNSDIVSTWTVSTVPNSTQYTFLLTKNQAPTLGTTQGTSTATITSSTTTARATINGHGLTGSPTVTISGASPSAFNGSFNVTVVDANTFTYVLPSAQGVATSNGSMTKTSTTATVATPAAHGFSANDSVTIAGANPVGYNGTFTIATVPTNTTFTISTSALTENISSTATVTKSAGTTATGTTATGNSFVAGSTYVTISGADSCYNGTYLVTSVVGTNFSYTLGSACNQNTATGMTATSGASFSSSVTATLSGHGYVVGNVLTIADGTVAAHNADVTVTASTADTFTYSNSAVTGIAPGSGYTVRLQSNPVAYATASGHGLTTGNQVTISGTTTATATPANASNAYNGTFIVTSIDSNSFSYVLTSAKGIQTASSGITASVNTSTATATSVNHGFSNGALVTISGASPSAFNGTFAIANASTNSFTYTMASAQGDATGTIYATSSGGAGSEKDQLVNWVRGQDNASDENGNGSYTDCRASVHGDVLHSRPAVINYNRYGGDNDVYVFYGANDGVFRAVKGGTGTDTGDTSGLQAGQEAWGFVPVEGFGSLSRLRNNSPVIGSSLKKPYFMDGPIGVYTKYSTGNTGQQIANNVFLYIGARRGGRYMYSLDVTNPTSPNYRWKIDSATAGFAELGQTWSQPTVVTGLNGYTNPVIIFGGGYDAAVEDVENCTITSVSTGTYSTSNVYIPGTVTYNNGTVTYNTTGTGCTTAGGTSTTVTRSMGRAIYMVDAITGQKIWSASYRGSGADLEVDGMDFAIPSDVQIIKNSSGGATNRGYVGDTGGNLWRIDFRDSDKTKWTVTKIAAIAQADSASNRRKFMSPPDVVAADGYDAVLIGSGDREHPFDNTVVNRFYMFKDHGNDSGPGTGSTSYLVGGTPTLDTRTSKADGSGNPVMTNLGSVTNASITSSNNDGLLYDATNNCIQTPSGSACGTTTSASEVAKLTLADGWYLSFGTGEKTIGNAVSLNGTVFFNTNQPSQVADASCVGNLGIARQYEVAVANATVPNVSPTASVATTDRYVTHAGGGFLPSPVHVVVQLLDSTGKLVTKEGVISGTNVLAPKGTTVGSRTRRFWYKELGG